MCVFKAGTQSLVSVMVGVLPGEVVHSLGQVKWVELKSQVVQKMLQRLYSVKMSSPLRHIHYTVNFFVYFPYYQ